MLNIYDYYDDAKSLPMYTEITSRLYLLNRQQSWGRSIPAEDLEPLLGIIKRSPEYIFYYARNVIGGRWPEVEHTLMLKPKYAFHYAEYILAKDPEWTNMSGHENGRWPEAEPYIMKDETAYDYAKYILKRRWPEAEPLIRQSIWWKRYKDNFEML